MLLDSRVPGATTVLVFLPFEPLPEALAVARGDIQNEHPLFLEQSTEEWWALGQGTLPDALGWRGCEAEGDLGHRGEGTVLGAHVLQSGDRGLLGNRGAEGVTEVRRPRREHGRLRRWSRRSGLWWILRGSLRCRATTELLLELYIAPLAHPDWGAHHLRATFGRGSRKILRRASGRTRRRLTPFDVEQ